MSNSMAIAAVTATLRGLIIRGTGITDVTARPLDNARRSATGNQINLFLYQVLPDAAWRNRDMPRQMRSGETGHPPLPLSLYYLLTAYSDDEDDTHAHRLLGQAMSVLHDHPLLGAEEINNATTPIAELVGSDLHEQIERVRITLQPLTFEEMSKLWTTFQTHYRVSAAYQVSVVLIESLRLTKTPLPVLQRGEEDRGVTSQPDLIPPFPALNSVQLPERQLSAQPGDVITLRGSRLSGGVAHLSSLRFPNSPQPATAAVNDAKLNVTLPADLAAGFYTIAVRLTTPKGEISSNELPIAVAPVVTTSLPLTVTRVVGKATIDLTCGVNVQPEQRVSLLLGDFEAQAEPHTTATNNLQFIVSELPSGDFPVPTGVGLLTRLRVDGVDSEIIAPRQPGEPESAPLRSMLDDATLPPSHHRIAEIILSRLRQTGAMQPLPVIQLLGSDAPSKQHIAQSVADALGLRLYRLPSELLPAHAAELESLARLAERETALWSLAIYLDAREREKNAPVETPAPPINRFLSRSNGVVFLDTLDVRQGLNRETVTLEIGKPTPAEQQSAWAAALGADSDDLAATLSAQFNLNLATIERIAAEVREQAPGDGETLLRSLWDGCLEATRPGLDGLAQRIEPKATWDDIVLPASELKLLRQIAAQVKYRGQVYEAGGFAASRSRGLSINALFAGESGTGKTMAAEVIANDLDLNLYRIDLSAVVNKYIGETEKNLRRLFDAAEDGGVILFFDEADALFGRRSEVKDSHDRYANIEVNYLLQRLESFTGLAIMATNMKSALDTAFLRRIRFVVEFRAHGLSERKLIWQGIFPSETKAPGLDYDRLARLNLNGGSINNVAINAAFLAAQTGTAVTMPLVLEAARMEFLKLKRPISEADFIWKEPMEAVA